MEKPTPRVRLTISVPADVHATFQRMAKASGTSIGWAMGEWLGDTLEAAEMTTTMMERARAAPKQVIRELNAMAQGFADEAGDLARALGRHRILENQGGLRAAMSGAEPGQGGPEGASPPSSNTGGKTPKARQPKPKGGQT